VPAGFGARLAQGGDETPPVFVIQKNQRPAVTAIQRGCDAPVAESAGDATSPVPITKPNGASLT
jgi:hypothetical protein